MASLRRVLKGGLTSMGRVGDCLRGVLVDAGGNGEAKCNSGLVNRRLAGKKSLSIWEFAMPASLTVVRGCNGRKNCVFKA